jgi:DNA-directed RNA polymerase alpha subunit
MNKEELLDTFAIEAMKASILRGGIDNAFSLSIDCYNLAEQMLNRRESILKGEKDSLLFKSIDEFGFTFRSINCLKAAGVFTIDQLLQHSPNDLLKMPNLGLKSQKEIIDILATHGVELRRPR